MDDDRRQRHIDEREHRREQLSDDQPIGGQPNVHDPSHPGIGDPADPRLTMPAGRVPVSYTHLTLPTTPYV